MEETQNVPTEHKTTWREERATAKDCLIRARDILGRLGAVLMKDWEELDDGYYVPTRNISGLVRVTECEVEIEHILGFLENASFVDGDEEEDDEDEADGDEETDGDEEADGEDETDGEA